MIQINRIKKLVILLTFLPDMLYYDCQRKGRAKTMTKQAKHTATPWGFDTINDCQDARVVIYSKNLRDLDEVASMVVFDEVEVAKANAAFIVKACNSHKALVEALRYVYSVLSNQDGLAKEKIERALKQAE